MREETLKHIPRHCQGFSLTELLMTLVILSILMGLASPVFSVYTANARRDSVLEYLISSFRLAQSVALESGQIAFVCPRNAASTACNGTDWSDGWIVFETDGAGGQTIISVVSDVPESVNINTLELSDASRVAFTPMGSIQDANAPGTFAACDNRGADFARAIVITNAGVMRKAIDSNDAGFVVEDSQGNDISC